MRFAYQCPFWDELGECAVVVGLSRGWLSTACVHNDCQAVARLVDPMVSSFIFVLVLAGECRVGAISGADAKYCQSKLVGHGW